MHVSGNVSMDTATWIYDGVRATGLRVWWSMVSAFCLISADNGEGSKDEYVEDFVGGGIGMWLL